MSLSCGALNRMDGILGELIDPRVGIIHHVEEVRPEPGAPRFFHFAAEGCNTAAFTRQRNFSSTGGASRSPERAVAKAIGEGVERYCAAYYDVDELPLHDSDSAPFPHVKPEAFALYTPEQYQEPGFPWVPFGPATPVRWVEAADPVSGEPCWVPAAMVFVPYAFYRGSGDSPITQPISTGLACHSTPARAALVGLCEVIERDAFTIAWQAMLSVPQIRVETLPDSAYDLVKRFEVTGSNVVLLDLTMDHGISTLLSVLRTNSTEGPALVFAAAASLDPESAAIAALEELAHTRRYSQQILSRMGRLTIEPGFTNVVDQLDHLNVYCDHNNRAMASFVFESKKRMDFDALRNRSSGSPERDLASAVDAVNAIGHRVLIADLTTPDVRDLGLTVVRVLVPGFHPLFMGHRIRALGGSRLWEVPQRLGYPGLRSRGSDNPAPHPYP